MEKSEDAIWEKLGKDKFIYNHMYMIILCLEYFRQHEKR